MKIKNENEVSFKAVYFNGGITYSDIIFSGVVIGSLMEQQTSILNPIIERYQMLAFDKDKHYFDGWIESEDEGHIFGYFHTLEKFIEYFNSKF